MSPTRLLGLILVVAGALMIAYGSFSYTQDHTAVKIGPVELAVKEKKTVDFPLWAGIAVVVVGGVLVVAGGRR